MEVHQAIFGNSVAFATDFTADRPEFAAVQPAEITTEAYGFQVATLADAAALRPKFIAESDEAAARQFEQMNGEDDFYSQQIKLDSSEICGGCSLPIFDKHLLKFNSRCWHESCLCCMSCGVSLESEKSCLFRDDSSMHYCKPCYQSQYGTKCASCDRVIQRNDWVRKARNFVYHLACFSCDQCKRQLSTGEEFSLQDNRLLCKQHFVELIEGDSGSQKQKTKRVRTTFAEEQLSVLQAHFQIDSNPDGADLERIANITGLSKRVTQVWFQNSRARQKKYQGGKRTDDESHRSSEDPISPSGKSDNSSDGMMYPTSVTTSAEDAIAESTVALATLQYE